MLLPGVCLCSFLYSCSSLDERALGQQAQRHEIAGYPEASTAAEAVVHAYYQSLFSQMQEAWEEHNGMRLQALVKQHQRNDLPASIKASLQGYSQLARSLSLEEALPQRCELRLLNSNASMHAEQQFEFILHADPDGSSLEIGGSGEDAAKFVVNIKVSDFDVLDDQIQHEHQRMLSVSRRHRLRDGNRLALAFSLPAAPAQAVARKLQMRVELWPCLVKVDGVNVPMIRAAAQNSGRAETLGPKDADLLVSSMKQRRPRYVYCCEHAASLYPAGFEPIQDKPLVTLREALRRQNPDYARHLYLAATFMPESSWEQALALLMTTIRMGEPSQARYAMAATRRLSGVDLAVDDRQGWLQWWQARKQEEQR